jgi:hypothetical protein
MSCNFTKGPVSAFILPLLLAQTGCYSQAYYPSYGAGYEVGGPYSDGYPVQGYEPAYPNGYEQPGYPGGYGQGDDGAGYQGQDPYGQGYQGNEDDDEDEGDESYDPNRPWQFNPYGGDYGGQ